MNSADLPTLKSKSPISLVTAPTPEAQRSVVEPYARKSTISPSLTTAIASDNLVSYHQIVDMMCKLESVGVPDSAYQTLTVPGSNDHAFALWRDWDGISDPHKQVRQDVIEFLDAHLK